MMLLVVSKNKVEGKKNSRKVVQSQSTVFQIGLRKKADTKLYSSSLEITEQNGRKVSSPATLSPSGDWQYIYFYPNVTGENEENFSWESKIEGKVINSGSFKSGLPLVRIPKDSYKKPSNKEAENEWESFPAFVVELSVWDKFKVFDRHYKATFIVTDPKGRKSKFTKDCNQDEFCDAIFPTDFQTDFKASGNYSWVCVINRQIAAGNSFKYTPSYIDTKGIF